MLHTLQNKERPTGIKVMVLFDIPEKKEKPETSFVRN
jgi:hypothetical protein